VNDCYFYSGQDYTLTNTYDARGLVYTTLVQGTTVVSCKSCDGKTIDL